MSLKSREEEEEEDVANDRERQQEREQQPNQSGLMNTAAFFSNFGETFSQV